MTTRLLPLALLALGMFIAGGCGTSDEHDHSSDGHGTESHAHPQGAGGAGDLAAAGIINETCPIMGDDVDPSLTVGYQGKKVGFCCDQCVSEWNDLSDAEKAARLAR